MLAEAQNALNYIREKDVFSPALLDSMDKLVTSGKDVHNTIKGKKLQNLGLFSDTHSAIDMLRKSNVFNKDVLDSMDKVVVSGKDVHNTI